MSTRVYSATDRAQDIAVNVQYNGGADWAKRQKPVTTTYYFERFACHHNTLVPSSLMGCTIGIPAPHSGLQSFPVSCAVMLGSLTSESCLATAVIHFFNADLDANAPGHLGAGTDQSGKALLTLAWSQDCSTGTLGHSTRSPMGPRMIEAVLHKTLDHTRAPSSIFNAQPIHCRGGHETATRSHR